MKTRVTRKKTESQNRPLDRDPKQDLLMKLEFARISAISDAHYLEAISRRVRDPVLKSEVNDAVLKNAEYVAALGHAVARLTDQGYSIGGVAGK